jgi:cytochrome o ubiquinol oxidase subunit 2
MLQKQTKRVKSMNKKTKPVFYMLLFTGFIFVLSLVMQPLQVYLFQNKIPFLFPSGIIAVEQRDLLFVLQILMLLVILPVYALTFIFSWRYRADNTKATYDPDLVDHKLAEIIWWGLPLVMVIIASVFTWVKTHELDPYKPIIADKKAIRIEVVALQWKWLFIYPEENIASVNYLQIPVDTPIHFEITADAPMNSLWIPDLGGQIYAMPGMRTELNLIANKSGEFRGSSANISGEGFAGMHFITKADSEQNFQDWVKSVKDTKNALDLSSYNQLAAPSQNVPPEIYRLTDGNLFDQVLMKYMKPQTLTQHNELK